MALSAIAIGGLVFLAVIAILVLTFFLLVCLIPGRERKRIQLSQSQTQTIQSPLSTTAAGNISAQHLRGQHNHNTATTTATNNNNITNNNRKNNLPRTDSSSVVVHFEPAAADPQGGHYLQSHHHHTQQHLPHHAPAPKGPNVRFVRVQQQQQQLSSQGETLPTPLPPVRHFSYNTSDRSIGNEIQPDPVPAITPPPVTKQLAAVHPPPTSL